MYKISAIIKVLQAAVNSFQVVMYMKTPHINSGHFKQEGKAG